jgi:hypothetical protein
MGVSLIVMLLGSMVACTTPDPADNEATLASSASEVQYSFFVAGHTYGVPQVNNEGVHPPFKAWFPELNSQNLDFGVFTGDIVMKSTAADWDEIDADLAELDPPVHFAVGNHDMGKRELFVSRYGPTYYSFEHEGDLFIILDTELDPGNISGEQLAFLRETLRSTEARNVFVFLHMVIWVRAGTPYYQLKGDLNNRKRYDFRSNFWTEVEPLLGELESEVYVVAGDVGVPWAMPLFYDHYEHIHLIASGMGGEEEENFLIFHVGSDDVQVEARRLDGKPLNLGSLEAYNLSHHVGGSPMEALGEIQVLDHRLGSAIRLLGYHLITPESAPGGEMRLLLYWQADATPQEDYTVFVHVLNDAGEITAQKDNMPGDGELPTSQWDTGPQIDDLHVIPLPSDLPPGEYRIAIGLYNWQTGERLPVHPANGEQVPESAIVLERALTVGD